MKNFLLFFALLLFSNQYSTQDFCLNNAAKGFNFGENYFDEPFEMLQQPDGRFIIIGTGYTNITNSFHIVGARVFADGNLDPTFGVQGKIDYIFDQRNTASCAALQDDGKILVAGYQAPSNGISGFRPYVARFNADGSVDTNFGDSGTALVPFSDTYPGEVAALKVFDDGSIKVVSNHSAVGFTTSKLLADGSTDFSYNGIGYTETNVPNIAMLYESPSSLILDDGTCYWMGYTYNDPIYNVIVAKVNPDGTPAIEFGTNGIRLISEIESTFNVELRSALAFDGNILISSVDDENLPFFVKVNSANGDLVTSFGNDGYFLGPFSSLGKRNLDFVKDEINQEWVLLFSDVSEDVGTMRMDDNGSPVFDCGGFFNTSDLNIAGSKGYTCGIMDQDGVIRIAGWAGITDEISPFSSQSVNFMWPYFLPPSPDPIITSITPNQLPLGTPVEVTIYGYGFDDTQDIKLISDLDTITQSAFEIISEAEINALFDPEMITLGLKDLVVYLSDDTLTLDLAVEIVDNEIIDGHLNVYSRKRILTGAQTLFLASYKNRGNKSMLASPLVFINENLYSMDFSSQPIYELQENDIMDDLITYLSDQGIDPDLISESVFEDDGGLHNAFLTTKLSPQEAKIVGGFTTISESTFIEQHIYLHPNPIVGSDGLLETYVPQPGYCTQEMVMSALLAAIPSADLSSYESCFSLSYTQLQSDLADIARTVNDERLIPMKGPMMKLLFDLMACLDNNYLINESEFEVFHAEMALLFATDVILNDAFPCESYVEASTYYHGLIEPPADDSPTNAFDKSDPWGIGIDFNFCYGCKTMNDIEGVSSLDPNEKIGPSQEFGGQFINNGDMNYAIHFENVDSAAIAAKTVRIIDSLDLDVFDMNTFKFTVASWGDQVEELSDGADVKHIDLRPEMPNVLRITTELDVDNGIAQWIFETLDTLSMNPTDDVDQGFLPPNVDAPEGMGFVGFEVQLIENIPSGTHIENDALIYFDFNDPIVTNNYINIYDDTAPMSQVLEITDYNNGETSATVQWEEENDDPNILFYNVYFNTDGGNDWIPWQTQTVEISAVFEGELDMTYYFMSVAVDSAFNVEEFEETYDAMIYMNPVGIDDVDGDNTFSLHPNPATDYVIVNMAIREANQVLITDMTGRLVLSPKIVNRKGQLIIQLDELGNGMYNVSIQDAEGRVLCQKKLMVHRK